MADMMAIVSKAVFEKAAGKSPTVGTKLRMDRYVSANKALDKLSGGGRLYLVTVRPPDEALWLVAVLDRPKFDGNQWIARASDTPITDISELKDDLVFESGKGLKAAKGQLGMTLQSPRALTQEDARLLDGAVGDDAGTGDAPAPRTEGFPAAPAGAVSTGAGNRRELLLAAVVADPDNLAARQVYADALVTANDPRGEFILLDMQLQGALSIRKRESLTQRKAELLREHARQWFPYAIKYRVKDGFITAVAGSLKQLNTAAGKLFATEPVTEVSVTSIDGEAGVEKLLAAPWLPRVHKLVIRGDIGNDGFIALVSSPAVAGLRALNVTGNDLGAEALAALRANLPSCRLLVLTNNPVGGGIVGLAKWDHLGEIETLYLGNCRLSAANCERLLDGPVLAKLTKLSLTDNELGNAIGKLIAKHAAKLPALEHLELQSTGIGTPAVKELAGAKLPALRRLDVRKNRVDAKLAADDPRITV